jgi:hypothetical protein
MIEFKTRRLAKRQEKMDLDFRLFDLACRVLGMLLDFLAWVFVGVTIWIEAGRMKEASETAKSDGDDWAKKQMDVLLLFGCWLLVDGDVLCGAGVLPQSVVTTLFGQLGFWQC